MQRIARSLRRLSPPALALPAAVVAMAVILRTGSDASDLRRWAAGDRAEVSRPASAAVAVAVADRAARIERVLGLSEAAARRVAVVDDRFHRRTIDEIAYADARGRPIAVVRFSASGDLLSAVHFAYRDTFAVGGIARDMALAKARDVIASLELPMPPGSPSARAMMNGIVWAVTWPRVAAGFPVQGDGVTVRIWRSGDIHSVTVSERPVSTPATDIGAERARAALGALLPNLLTAERRADATLSEVGRRWVAANDRYRSEGSDAPAPVLRLAYVFELQFAGPGADLVRALAFWIDAETGALIGGDVLR